MARRLAKGLDVPDWAAAKVAALGNLTTWTRRLLAALDRQMQADVATAVLGAQGLGVRLADQDIAAIAKRDPDLTAALHAGRFAANAEQLLPGSAAIRVLAAHLTDRLRSAATPVLRWVEDAYREVIAAGAAPDVLAGIVTRRAASERAWNQLLGQGITGFVDRAGRRWNLATYVEMATRTSVAQAAVEAHLGRLGAIGLDLVVVSDAPQECILCRPWEGKVLGRSGPPGPRTVAVEHATQDGVTVDVHVAGTVDQAVAAGLLHPNCRHSLSAYLPGVTELPEHTADPAGDAARQKLRTLERRVRRAKVQASGALSPAGAAAARRNVAAGQAAIRDHVTATGLIRQPSREQIDLGNKRDHTVTGGTVAPVVPKTPVVPKVKPVVKPPAPPAPPTPPPAKATRNPTELTGSRPRWWEDIPDDTGNDPIPVRQLDIGRGYTVQAGAIHRIDGVSMLIEDGSSTTSSERIAAGLDAFQKTLPPDASQYQLAYAWLAGRNPDDAYWARTKGMAGFKSGATAARGGTNVWEPGWKVPENMDTTLRHEFGHNVSDAAVAKGSGLDDGGIAWLHAGAADNGRRHPVFTRLDARSSGHHTITMDPDPGAAYPYGVTGYAKTAIAEDYAESVMLYLSPYPVGEGHLVPGGPVVPIWFRDVWPSRAAVLDQVFPQFAREQLAQISARRPRP
jgi:hypothetical protein